MKKLHFLLLVLMSLIWTDTTASAQEAYAVLSNSNTVLTFYYDNNKTARSGLSIGPFSENSKRWDSKAKSIKTVIFDSSFSSYRPTSTAYWFSQCNALTTINGIENLRTDNVTDMRNMFDRCSCVFSLDVRGFNTSNVTNMGYMFNGCICLANLDVSNFQTSKVISMSGMFSGCSSLKSLDVSKFNTSSVKDMSYMFNGCSDLTSLDVSNFNTSNVTDMGCMFMHCSGLTNLDVSSFTMKNTTVIGGMFNYCTHLETIYCDNNWSASVAYSSSVFPYCYSLIGGQGTKYNQEDSRYAHVDGGAGNPGYFTSTSAMPKEAYASYSDGVLTFYYDNKKKSRKGISIGPFNGTTNINGVNNVTGRDWNDYVSSITKVVFDESFAEFMPTSTAYWFYDCTVLKNIVGIENLKTGDVTDMKWMFFGCSGLANLDVSKFNTSKVTDMTCMFASCSGLTNLDVSKFNTSNVTDMTCLFSNCSSLTSLDVSSFNTSRVTEMSFMFNKCSSLSNLDVSNFNTSNVTNMVDMFFMCSGMTTLDLSSFNTNKVTKMSDMFYRCSGLNSIIVSSENWDVSNVTISDRMFSGCTSLVGGMGTKYDENNVDASYAHIDGGTVNPGYLTDVNAPKEPEAYAALSENNTILTFYYDTDKASRKGMNIEVFSESDVRWNGLQSSITTVVFDGSFADYRPTSTANWFNGCISLADIIGIENLKTDSVTDMGYMFNGCGNIVTLSLDSFHVGNVTNTSNMFADCVSLTTIYTDSNWAEQLILNSSNMFQNCSSIVGGKGTKYDPNFTDKSYAYVDGGVGNPGYFTNRNSSNFPHNGEVTAYAVLNDGTLTFYYDNQYADKAGSLFDIADRYGYDGKLPGWYDVRSRVQNVAIDASFSKYKVASTAYWFYDMGNLSKIEGLERLNTRNVTDMSYMFAGCKQLTSANVSDFLTSSVTDFSYMFSGCQALEKIDVSCFKTDNATTMQAMFNECSSIKELVVSGFSTLWVKNFSRMFQGCSNLTSLYLGNFITNNATSMQDMFSGCSHLKTIYARENWKMSHVTDGTKIFVGCTNLVGGVGTSYSESNVSNSYARIDGEQGVQGYFTLWRTDNGVGKAYAVLNNGELTFYYDDYRQSRPGTIYSVENSMDTEKPLWFYDRGSIKEARIDSSFAEYYPVNTARWFYNCSDLKTVEGLEYLNTDSVTNMNEMFRFCYDITSLDVSHFNTSKVTDMGCLFCYCSSLTSLDVSHFNTGNVTNMEHMFHTCPVTELDLSNFNTSKVVDMNTMFSECKSLTTIYASKLWTKENVGFSSWMFSGCDNLVGGCGTKYDWHYSDKTYALIDEGISNPGYLTEKDVVWEREAYVIFKDSTLSFYYDDQKASREGTLFNEDVAFRGTGVASRSVRRKTSTVIFDVSFADYNGITTTAHWFDGCNLLKSVIGIENLKTDNVTDMSYMFEYCQSLTSLDLSNFNTENVTDMRWMFHNCTRLSSLDVSNFNTANVTDMRQMFEYCRSLSSLDVSKFNTSNVTNMSYMFEDCHSLTSLDVSNFNTTNVTDMCRMFFDCRNLTSLDVSKFNTENVTNMNGMFTGCSGLTSLDVSNFKTSNVTDMSYMFLNSSGMTTIKVDADNWSTSNVTDSENMFSGCTSLVGGKGTTYDANHTDASYAHIDGGTSNPGYLTDVNAPQDNVAISAKSYTRVYGEENPKFEYDVTEGTITSGEPNISCEATTKSPVGSYDIVIEKGTVTNSNVELTNGTLTITKAPLTVSGGTYTMKQGDTLPEFAAEYDGFKNGETSEVLTKQPVMTTSATSTSEPGTYEIAASGAEAENYEISYVKGTLTITDTEPVKVTAKSYTIEYGESIPAFEYTSEGASLRGVPEIRCAATAGSAAGTYDIVISKGSVSNFNDTYVNGTLTITKAPLVISVGEYTKQEGEENPEFELTYEGFKNGESDGVLTKLPVVTCVATKDSEPGEYVITIDGAEAENYDIRYAPGKLTVTPKPLPEITPIEGEISVNTEGLSEADLTDNVVNDVYYNVGEQGYDAAEKSIVISEATNMAQIADKEPGSKDVKESFNGIIMKVGKGFGLITVSAKTSGNAQLVVQVGESGMPMIASRTEKGDVVVSYDVSEDTYVYIYAILGSSAAKLMYGDINDTDTDSSVRIYGITVSPDATGIRSVNGNDNGNGNDDAYYTIDGKKLDAAPKKGEVYIRKGRKVVK